MTEEKTMTFDRQQVWELALVLREKAKTSVMEQCVQQALRELVAADAVLNGQPFALSRENPDAWDFTEDWVAASVVGDSIRLTPTEKPAG